MAEAASSRHGDRYRWVVLAAGSFAQTSVSVVLIGIPVLAPQLREHFGISLGATGVVLAALSIGMTPTLLLWGMLADRLGEQIVLSTGLAGAAVALVGAGVVRSYGAFVCLLIVAGALAASVNAASGRAVMQWFPREERGLALGIRQANVPFGGLIAAVTLPPLVSGAGIGWTFASLGGICALGAAAGAIWMRSPGGAAVTAGLRVGPLRDPAAWRISLAGGFLLVAQFATTGFTVLFLHSQRTFSLGDAAAVLAAAQVLGVALRILAGHWSDRANARIVPLRRLSLWIAGALAAFALVANAPRWALVPLLVAAGGLALSWNGLAFTAAAENAGVDAAGAALGLQQTVLGVAGIIAPIGFAALVGESSWRIAFFAAGLFPLVAWIVLRPLAER